MIYDLVLAFGVLGFLPKILFKKKLPTLRQRLGLDIPTGKNGFWIHAVSVGEVKSAKGLVEKIRSEYPLAHILITTATATGQEEARRSLKQANAYHFLPLDFSFIMRRWMKALSPRALIIVESDFWYNLLNEAKKVGTKTFLVSGKLSSTSARNFKALRLLSRKLFSLFDCLLVQGPEHLARFAPLARNPIIGGNLKLDATPVPVDRARYAPFFTGFNILISCTHDPEEELLLDALEQIPGTLYIAPRHPERYDRIASLLTSKNIPHVRWSALSSPRPTRVVLIDSMGLLPIFYTFCDLVIVAGSFVSDVGGHNILEPCLYGTPVYFGPHMHQQTELTTLVLAAKAGKQTTLPTLSSDVLAYMANSAPMRQSAQHLALHRPAALETTWSCISSNI